MNDLPNLFDGAIGMYEACIENVKAGHNDTCHALLDANALGTDIDITDCTCGYREALKSIAYVRGDDPIEVDKGNYTL